jgi:hypothetical protein
MMILAPWQIEKIQDMLGPLPAWMVGEWPIGVVTPAMHRRFLGLP